MNFSIRIERKEAFAFLRSFFFASKLFLVRSPLRKGGVKSTDAEEDSASPSISIYPISIYLSLSLKKEGNPTDWSVFPDPILLSCFTVLLALKPESKPTISLLCPSKKWDVKAPIIRRSIHATFPIIRWSIHACYLATFLIIRRSIHATLLPSWYKEIKIKRRNSSR